MDDRSRILLSAVLGALAGGVAGYLYLTDDGRRVRERLEPGLEDLGRELRRLRGAIDRARVAAEEGWQTIEDLRRPAARPGGGWGGSGRPPTAS
ncbi:MAG: YtxH domain-containing protein [Acidobacteriota bacterium]